MFVYQIVNSIFESNTYIISDSSYQNCWLVDCGDAEILIDWIKEHNKKLSGIFITHSHFDHIYGLNLVVSAFPECIVYTSGKGKEGLFSDKLNFSRYNCDGFIYQFDNICILEDNNKIEIYPDVFMSVIETPGHDWSCLAYSSQEFIFTGDSYLPDYKVMTKFPKSNKVQAEESLIKIKEFIALGAKNVFPGHGDVKLFV